MCVLVLHAALQSQLMFYFRVTVQGEAWHTYVADASE